MNFYKLLIPILFSILCVQFNFAQQSTSFQIDKTKTIKVSEIDDSWHAKVFSLEAPYPGSDSYRNYIHQLKQLKFGNTNTIETTSIANSNKTGKTNSNQLPILNTGFSANRFGGIPNDNDIAVSNDGFVVSVCNSDVYIYDKNGVELEKFALSDFSDSLNLTATNHYDPKVIYDVKEDKFILVYLNGSDASATSIVVCFSQTNDPTLDWNLYSLPGNPFNDDAWSDFPMISINEQDFFVSVNHIHSDSASWQTGFMQSVIWQVEKESGYNGGTLNSVVHSNIKSNNKPIRNLRPVKAGIDLKSNEMYFVSNKNFDFLNDTFFLAKINESLIQNPNPSVQVEIVLSDKQYGLPPDAKQTATTFFQTNDARPLGAFIENGQIHFVGNTVDETTNLAAIYHGKINTYASQKAVELNILSDTVLEYGYPNISFSGQNKYDEQAIISFNHTSIDSFPGMSAIFYSLDEAYSERLHLVSGNSNVNVINGNFERWGDYSGSQRKYNEPGKVWINGFKGFYNNFALSKNQHNTFVASLSSPDTTFTNISIANNIQNKLYPNPVNNSFYLQFKLATKSTLSFKLYDVNGQLVDELLSATTRQGDNQFMFNTASLSKGVYFLNVSDQTNTVLINEKIIKK